MDIIFDVIFSGEIFKPLLAFIAWKLLDYLKTFFTGPVSDAKDGHYFLRVLDKEAQRLLGMADKVEQEMDMVGMSEEIKGKLRSASGKARLLVSQKMQQFKGLCSKNITQVQGEQFPTTSEDLQGFWDMVMLQVDQVDQLFKEIDELRNNNWNEIAEVKLTEAKSTGSVKVRKAAPRPKPNSVNELARKQREAERKKLIEERRKAMKAQQQNKPKDDIEIFVPETS